VHRSLSAVEFDLPLTCSCSSRTGCDRRWGYGMFAIILPVCTSPALYILFWADMKAQKLGVSLKTNPRRGGS
jgi:hypothetical protein